MTLSAFENRTITGVNGFDLWSTAFPVEPTSEVEK
jgi:hypothetical protein